MRESFLVQFRLVLLDDQYDVKEVIYESDKHELCNGWNSSAEMDTCLLKADERFHFDDWENVPLIEFQGRERGDDTWYYLSDPLEDWFNL